MTKLLNLTIKLNDKDKYDKVTPGVIRDAFVSSRLIEIAGLEIKDQAGNTITELKKSQLFGNFQVGDIENIKLPFSVLDIPIS